MATRFIDVLVDPTPALPEGCCIRFKSHGAEAPVRAVLYEPDDGPDGVWQVHARHGDGSLGVARSAVVEDSSAGTSVLIWGGDLGLCLRHDNGQEVSEPYLLLAPDQVLAAGS